jgi:CspA family cold shock protein
VKQVKEQGTVKWFDVNEGVGFIQRQSGEELFVHASDVEANGKTSLHEGEKVEFEIWKGLRGLQAAKVVALGPQNESMQVVISLRFVASDFERRRTG